MVINIFINNTSKEDSKITGIGIVIFNGKEKIKEISKLIENTSNGEAIYETLVLAINETENLQSNSINLFTSSQLLIKQLKDESKIQNENIKNIADKALTLIKNKNINCIWIRQEDNKIATKLSNNALNEYEHINQKNNKNNTKPYLILDKAFFGQINCFKIQMNPEFDIYFHLGLTTKGSNVWNWKKIKMSDSELAEIIHILKQETGKCSFFHSFDKNKTQIWCNKNPTSFSIKVDNISKNLNIGEFVTLRILIEECIRKRNFN